MQAELIAPCGANCSTCTGYLAYKHQVKQKGVKMPYCQGCRPQNKQCAWLKKRCGLLLNNKINYCFECPDYPCDKLKHIDKRYRTLFRTSFLSNLDIIKEEGIEKLLEKEGAKWKCPQCGDVICCHNGICYSCGLESLRSKKMPWRWEGE
jgi:hypothetical protein